MRYIVYYCLLRKQVNTRYGSIAQLGEHLPYKQRVTGSIPVVPTMNNIQKFYILANVHILTYLYKGLLDILMEEFPSGQRGQTVNLLRNVSMVRIRPPPPFIIF